MARTALTRIPVLSNLNFVIQMQDVFCKITLISASVIQDFWETALLALVSARQNEAIFFKFYIM